VDETLFQLGRNGVELAVERAADRIDIGTSFVIYEFWSPPLWSCRLSVRSMPRGAILATPTAAAAIILTNLAIVC